MNNQHLAQEGLTLISQLNSHQPVATSSTAIGQLLHETPQLNAYLIAERQAAAVVAHANLVQLFQKVDQHFNDSELRDLAFQLGVEYEDLGGPAKRDKARELITFAQRHVRLPQLVNLAAALRPRVEWHDKPQQAGGLDIISRLDVAVIIDVARPTLLDVARYLDEQDRAVNFVLFKHPQPNAFLSAENKWDELVRAFAQAMNNTKHRFSGARLHFFLSAPGALIFGLGCIWGTVDEATVYHYERGTYYPVIAVSRTLRV